MATTYTPSQNTDLNKAAFGEQSAGVSALQSYLNEKNKGVAGYTPIAVDGKYGLQTQNAFNFKPTTDAISSASLVPTPKVDIPTPTPTPDVKPVTTNAAADAIFNNSQVAKDATQIKAEGLSNSISDAIAKLTGQDQALADENKKAGVDTLKSDLQSINSQILKKQAELAQSDVELIANMRAEERRDTLLPFAQSAQAKLAGDAAILRALKQSEIGVLNSSAIAKQGDIALAKDTAQQAVDLKYAPYKDIINIGKAQLEALAPILSTSEKKQAAQQTLRANMALKEIDKVSEFQKKALENALTNNAPQSVINKINSAHTIADITSLGGQYITSAADKLDLELKRATIAEKYASASEKKQASIKPLSSDAAKMLAISQGLETDINKIKAKIDKVGYKTFLQGYLLGTDRESVKLLGSASDKIGRIRSGGAINKDEEKRFLQQFASFGDLAFADKSEAENAINSILTEAQTVRTGIDPNGLYSTPKNTEDSYIDTVVNTISSTGTPTSSSYAQSIYQTIQPNK